jgi:hypothetical protein
MSKNRYSSEGSSGSAVVNAFRVRDDACPFSPRVAVNV